MHIKKVILFIVNSYLLYLNEHFFEFTKIQYNRQNSTSSLIFFQKKDAVWEWERGMGKWERGNGKWEMGMGMGVIH